MNNIISKLLVVTILSTLMILTSCNKSADKTAEINKVLNPIEVKLKKTGEITLDDVNAYLVVEMQGRFNSCDYSGVTLSASFNNQLDAPGEIIIGGEHLDKIEEDGKVRYLKTLPASQYELGEIIGASTISCDLHSELPEEYASFSEDFSIPSDFCASSSLGASEVLSKNNDLTLSWNTSEEDDLVYVSICSPGKPCIIKELEDSGEATIPRSEFAKFDRGQPVYLYLGRGTGSVIEQSNGIKIGIIRLQWSNYPGLTVE